MPNTCISFEKTAQRLAEFCQRGEILPNLVTLVESGKSRISDKDHYSVGKCDENNERRNERERIS